MEVKVTGLKWNSLKVLMGYYMGIDITMSGHGWGWGTTVLRMFGTCSSIQGRRERSRNEA